MVRVLLTFVLFAALAEAEVVARGTSQRAVFLHTQKAKKILHAKASEDPPAAAGTVKAPEQGFEGKDVQHVDMETSLGDWRREYSLKLN